MLHWVATLSLYFHEIELIYQVVSIECRVPNNVIDYVMMDNFLPILSSVSPLLQSEVVACDADGEGEDDGGTLLHGDRVQGL